MHRCATTLACALALGLAVSGTASAAPYDKDTVIVKYTPGVSPARSQDLIERTGATRTLGRVTGLGARVLRVRDDPAEVARRLNRSPLVVYAEPNYVLRALAVPNDARFGELYGLNNTGQTGGSPDADIDAPEGWDLAGLGTFPPPPAGAVKVGIVDTGIDQGHEDLIGTTADCARSIGFLIFPGTLREGTCADDNDHGTHLAGTVAARANNGVGVAGVAFNTRLTVCKALNAVGAGLTSDIANCIGWAHSKGAKVISMSFGGSASTTLGNAVAGAWEGGGPSGSVLVAAAGNDGNSTLRYPAGYPEVVSVAATDSADRRAPFSNANSDVEVAAPGVDILSTKRGGGYLKASGTSMAAPHASAVAGIIWQLSPGSRADSVRARLDAAVDDLGTAGRDTSFGFGRVNLCKAAGGSCAYGAGL